MSGQKYEESLFDEKPFIISLGVGPPHRDFFNVTLKEGIH